MRSIDDLPASERALIRAQIEVAANDEDRLTPHKAAMKEAVEFCNEAMAKRVLILCHDMPPVEWMGHVRDWSTMRYPYTIYPVLTERNGVHPTAAWTIASYSMAKREPIRRALQSGRFDVLILDSDCNLATPDRTVFGGPGAAVAASIMPRATSVIALTPDTAVVISSRAESTSIGEAPDS
jgi:hypothetical protein